MVRLKRFLKRADRDYTGIKQNYYTTMEGMIKKYKKGDEEFDLPQGLLDLYKKERLWYVQRQRRATSCKLPF